jgi:hypothetical protein
MYLCTCAGFIICVCVLELDIFLALVLLSQHGNKQTSYYYCCYHCGHVHYHSDCRHYS